MGRGVEDGDDCVGGEMHDAKLVVSMLGLLAQSLDCVFVASHGAFPDR